MTITPASDRRLQHATVDEVITFIETAADTGGRRTLVEVDLGPGGGTPMHRHRRFQEVFEVLDGQLTVWLDGKPSHLAPGDVVTVPIGSPHRFQNLSDGPVRFRTAITPAEPGFERLQQVGFGLAQDRRIGRNAMPKDPRHVALMLAWSDTNLVGLVPRLLSPVLRLLVVLARVSGEERRLIDRYVTF
ncbi:MAG: cupin domain-containing protein [Solirubrobacteraceae bacterium]|nr:cupin domain-containing protein [Patulibacter sp.]